MSDIPINLNKMRKARAKSARRQRGDENAIRFGRSKGEKALEKERADKVIRHLDRHKRDP